MILGSSLILFFLAPWSRDEASFYKGQKKDQEPGFWVLTSSLVISWLFAKSITNAANLGLSFGIVGGIAYAAYYLSFIVAGIVLYQIRVKGGFSSIHDFLQSKYGRGALLIFSLLISFRLFNEVWSNTMVIGSYFGEAGSNSYLIAVLVFTVLTLAYTLKGGFSSSLLTDVIQMVLFVVLITAILGMILPDTEGGVVSLITSGEWTFAQGGNLLLVAIIQSFSYPFHDPVMTDRAFLSKPKTTLKAFVSAAFIGGVCIILFSFVGIYGQTKGLSGQAPVEVAKLLGITMMLIINFIMITSAASTLDSTFSSFAKLATKDLNWMKASVSNGRLAMIIITILGTIPVFLGPEILSATTVSGTMVIGLAPVFLFWKWGRGKWSFALPVIGGLLIGLLYVFLPNLPSWTSGKYNTLLWINVIGSVLCFILFFLGVFIDKMINHE